MYGPRLEKQQAIRLKRDAYDRGVTFFYTAQVYQMFADEESVGKAFAPFRDKRPIATSSDFSFRWCQAVR